MTDITKLDNTVCDFCGLQPTVDKFPSGLYSHFKFFLYDEIIPAVIAFYYGNDYNYEKETTYDTWRKDLQTES